MFKKILAGIACFSLLFTLTACNTDKDVYSSSEVISETENNEDSFVINTLTGVRDLDADKASNRPVAVMVNNVSVAQAVQTGISKADIIYETEVEGGITRLMAVYSDITEAEKIGTVRSARYPYVDLALGHDAVYIHCGQDPTYCAPHLKDIDHISIDTNSQGAKRISNGLSSEHTLYALADDLFKNISGKFNMSAKNNASWVNFADEDETVSLTGGSAKSISIPFPASTTKFTYDSQSALYTRLIGGNVQTDYYTGETTQVRNVFVLFTSISNYPDGKHRKVELQSGDGYYMTNGQLESIKWTKGSAKKGFEFTDSNGNVLTVSAGNSWVCIADKNTCSPTIQ